MTWNSEVSEDIVGEWENAVLCNSIVSESDRAPVVVTHEDPR